MLMRNNVYLHKSLIGILSFAIPACMLTVMFAVLGVFPGGEHTILTIDLAAQYTDFFSYFKGFFQGENHLFYCLSQTLGNNMWGILPYYLLSPFNFILLFFTSGQLPTAIFIMTILKIGACGFTCQLFLAEVYRSRYTSLIFSVCYAFMSFNIVYLSHIMWLDGVILLPFIALGIHRMIQKKKPLCYILSLFAALVTNYYIGYMLCIFTVLYFVYCVLRSLPTVEKLKYFGKKTANYVLSSLIAGGMSAIVLLPTFFALSGNKSSVSSGLSFSLKNVLFDIFGQLYTNMFEYADLRDGLPNIFIGIFILVLTVLFFVHKTISLYTKLLAGGLVAVLILSFHIVSFDLVWHAFALPNMFTHRYAFIFGFILITLAIESFQALRASKPPILRYSITGAALFAVTVMLGFFTNKLASKSFLLDLGLIVAFYILLYFVSVQVKKWLQAASIICIAVISTGNMGTNGYHIIEEMPYDTAYEFTSYHNDKESIITKAKSLDDSVYRIEMDFFYTLNDAMYFSYNGISHYSSNLKMSLVNFFKKTGYQTNDVFISNGKGNTIAFDSMYNIKYFISDKEYTSQYQKVYTEGALSIFENPYALGLGFAIPENIGEMEFSERNPFDSQNSVFQSFVPQVEKNIFIPEELVDTVTENTTIKNENGKIILEKLDIEKPATVSYIYKRSNPQDPIYVSFGGAERKLKAEIRLNGETVDYSPNYHGAYYDYIHPLHISDTQADTYTITVELLQDNFVLGTPYVYRQDMAIFRQYYEKLADGSFNAAGNSKASFSGTVTVNANERLFLSLPYEKGWTAYVNGQSVETEPVFDTFLSVKIPEGTHTVVLSFIPPGFVVGSTISSISVVTLVSYLILLHWINKRKQF